MKTRALLFLAIATIAAAADLKLSDGRTLKDYRIVSQTPSTVLVRHAGGAAKIEKKLLPPAVLKEYPIDEQGAFDEASKIAEGKAEYAAQVKAQEEKRAADHAARLEKNKATKESELEVARREGKREAELAAARAAGKKEVTQAAAQKARTERLIKEHNARAAGEIDEATVAAIEQAVRSRASEYFKAQYKAPASGLTIEVNVRIDELRSVPGYNDRYEVKGSAWWERYESRGRSFEASSSRFEADVRREKGRLQVVGFTTP